MTLASAYCTQSDRPSACVQLRSEHSKVTEIVRALWRRRAVMIAGLMLRCHYSFSTHFFYQSAWSVEKNEHLNIETNHGRRRIFFPKVGSEGRKFPSRVEGQLSGGGLGAKPPETDDNFSKWCINTSSTEVLDNICSKKNTFRHFQGKGQVPTLPMPAGVHETNATSHVHAKKTTTINS